MAQQWTAWKAPTAYPTQANTEARWGTNGVNISDHDSDSAFANYWQDAPAHNFGFDNTVVPDNATVDAVQVRAWMGPASGNPAAICAPCIGAPAAHAGATYWWSGTYSTATTDNCVYSSTVWTTVRDSENWAGDPEAAIGTGGALYADEHTFTTRPDGNWGGSSVAWTVADIRDSSFSVRFASDWTSGGAQLYCHHVLVRVQYTVPDQESEITLTDVEVDATATSVVARRVYQKIKTGGNAGTRQLSTEYTYKGKPKRVEARLDSQASWTTVVPDWTLPNVEGTATARDDSFYLPVGGVAPFELRAVYGPNPEFKDIFDRAVSGNWGGTDWVNTYVGGTGATMQSTATGGPVSAAQGRAGWSYTNSGSSGRARLATITPAEHTIRFRWRCTANIGSGEDRQQFEMRLNGGVDTDYDGYLLRWNQKNDGSSAWDLQWCIRDAGVNGTVTTVGSKAFTANQWCWGEATRSLDGSSHPVLSLRLWDYNSTRPDTADISFTDTADTHSGGGLVLWTQVLNSLGTYNADATLEFADMWIVDDNAADANPVTDTGTAFGVGTVLLVYGQSNARQGPIQTGSGEHVAFTHGTNYSEAGQTVDTYNQNAFGLMAYNDYGAPTFYGPYSGNHHAAVLSNCSLNGVHDWQYLAGPDGPRGYVNDGGTPESVNHMMFGMWSRATWNNAGYTALPGGGATGHPSDPTYDSGNAGGINFVGLAIGYLMQETGEPVGLVPVAKHAQPISYFDKDYGSPGTYITSSNQGTGYTGNGTGNPPNAYCELLQRVEQQVVDGTKYTGTGFAAKAAAEIGGMIWLQGENNANPATTTKSAYKSAFGDLLTDLNTDIGLDTVVAFTLGEIYTAGYAIPSGGTYDSITEIRQALLEAETSTTGGLAHLKKTFDTYDLPLSTYSDGGGATSAGGHSGAVTPSDGIHITREREWKRAAWRSYVALREALWEKNPVVGPVLQSVAYDPNTRVLQLTFDQAVATPQSGPFSTCAYSYNGVTVYGRSAAGACTYADEITPDTWDSAVRGTDTATIEITLPTGATDDYVYVSCGENNWSLPRYRGTARAHQGVSTADELYDIPRAETVTAEGLVAPVTGDQTVDTNSQFLPARPFVQVLAEQGPTVTSRLNTFSAGSDGTALSTGNSGGDNGDAFDTVYASGTNAGTSNFEATDPYIGGTCLQVDTSATNPAAPVYHGWDLATDDFYTIWVGKIPSTPDGIPTANSAAIIRYEASGTELASIRIQAANYLQCRNVSGTLAENLSTAIPADQYVRIEAHFTVHASNGGLLVKCWFDPQDTGTPDIEIGAETGYATGTAGTGTDLFYGVTAGSQESIRVFEGAVGYNIAGWYGPISIPSPPGKEAARGHKNRKGASTAAAWEAEGVFGGVISASGYNGEAVRWNAIQPTVRAALSSSVMATIVAACDQAVADGTALVLRVLPGRHAPSGCKARGQGPIEYEDSGEGAPGDTFPRWWLSEVLADWDDLAQRIADWPCSYGTLDDHPGLGIFVCGYGGTLYAEPCIRQVATTAVSTPSYGSVGAGGYQTWWRAFDDDQTVTPSALLVPAGTFLDNDMAAILGGLDAAVTRFAKTRVSLSLAPFQAIYGDGTAWNTSTGRWVDEPQDFYTTDTSISGWSGSTTLQLMLDACETAGRQLAFMSNSARYDAGAATVYAAQSNSYEAIYRAMRALRWTMSEGVIPGGKGPGALGIQTAATNKLVANGTNNTTNRVIARQVIYQVLSANHDTLVTAPDAGSGGNLNEYGLGVAWIEMDGSYTENDPSASTIQTYQALMVGRDSRPFGTAEPVEGAVAAAGSGTISAAGETAREGAVAAAGSGTFTPTGDTSREGAVTATASGMMTPTGDTLREGAASGSGSGTISATGDTSREGAASGSGSGTISATGDTSREGAASGSGAGSISVTGDTSREGAAAGSGSGGLAAEGETAREGSAAAGGSGTISPAGDTSREGAAAGAGAGTTAAAGDTSREGSAAAAGAGTVSAAGDTSREGSATAGGSGDLAAEGSASGEGAAAGAGSGGMAVTGDTSREGAVTVQGSGAMAPSGDTSREGAAAGAGSGTISATGDTSREGAVAGVGEGGMTVDGDADLTGTVAAGGEGGMTVDGDKAGEGAAAAGGSGTVSATGHAVREGATAGGGAGSLTVTGGTDSYGAVTTTGSGTISATGDTSREGAAAGTGEGAISVAGDTSREGAVTAGGEGTFVIGNLLPINGGRSTQVEGG